MEESLALLDNDWVVRSFVSLKKLDLLPCAAVLMIICL